MKPYLVFVFENGDDCVVTEDDEFVIHFATLARSSTLFKVVLLAVLGKRRANKHDFSYWIVVPKER